MKPITLNMAEKDLERLDALVIGKFYPNRAEAIRLAIHDLVNMNHCTHHSGLRRMPRKLEGSSKLYQSHRARTMYLTIPARIARDSQFPFRDGDKVSVSFHPEDSQLLIQKRDFLHKEARGNE